MAWPGAQHLKVNFAPDGTTVDSNYQSALFSTLNAKSSAIPDARIIINIPEPGTIALLVLGVLGRRFRPRFHS